MHKSVYPETRSNGTLTQILIGLSNMCGINLKYRDELVRRGLLHLVLRAAKAALKQEDHPKDLPLNHGTQADGEFRCPFLNEHVRNSLVWLISNLTISPMECCTVDDVVLY